MIRKILLIIAILLTLTSCYESINPLRKSNDALLDDRLPGLWQYKNKLSNGKIEKGYFLIHKGINNFYQVYTQDRPFIFNNSLASNFQAFITKVGREHYLNLQPLEINNGKQITRLNKNYIFANYYFRNNRLTIRLLDDSFIKKAIKKKLVKGEIIDRTDFRITASPKKLRKFFKRYRRSIHSTKKLVLRKLNFK